MHSKSKSKKDKLMKPRSNNSLSHQPPQDPSLSPVATSQSTNSLLQTPSRAKHSQLPKKSSNLSKKSINALQKSQSLIITRLMSSMSHSISTQLSPHHISRRFLQIKWTPAEDLPPNRRRAEPDQPTPPPHDQPRRPSADFDPTKQDPLPSPSTPFIRAQHDPDSRTLRPPRPPPTSPSQQASQQLPQSTKLSRKEHAMHRPTHAPDNFQELLKVEPAAAIIENNTFYPHWSTFPSKEPMTHYETMPLHDHTVPDYAHRDIFEQLPLPPPLNRKTLLQQQLDLKERLHGLKTLEKKQEFKNVIDPPYVEKLTFPKDLQKTKEAVDYARNHLARDVSDPTILRKDSRHRPGLPEQKQFTWGERQYEPPERPTFGMRELHPLEPPSKSKYIEQQQKLQQQFDKNKLDQTQSTPKTPQSSQFPPNVTQKTTNEEYVERIRQRLRHLERTQQVRPQPGLHTTTDQINPEPTPKSKPSISSPKISSSTDPSSRSTFQDTESLKFQKISPKQEKSSTKTSTTNKSLHTDNVDDSSDIDFPDLPRDIYDTPSRKSRSIDPILSRQQPFDNADVIDRAGDNIRSKIDLSGSKEFLANRKANRSRKEKQTGTGGGGGRRNNNDDDNEIRFDGDDNSDLGEFQDDEGLDDEDFADSLGANMRDAILTDDANISHKKTRDTISSKLKQVQNKKRKLFDGFDDDSNDSGSGLEDLYDPIDSIDRIHELFDANRDILDEMDHKEANDDYNNKKKIIEEIQRLAMNEAEERAEEIHKRNLHKLNKKMKNKTPEEQEKLFGPGDRHWKRPGKNEKTTTEEYANDPEYLRAKLRQDYQDELPKAIRKLNGEDGDEDDKKSKDGLIKTRPDDSDLDVDNIEADEDTDDRQLRLLYGNRVNKTQYMISKVQSEALFITHKTDFFQGINPRTDYRPSKQQLEFNNKLQQLQFEYAQRRLRDPTFIIPTTEELIDQGQLQPPLIEVDDEFSSAATAQTYNNIRVYETYLSALEPRFLPTCNVFAMHTLLTRDQKEQLDKQPPPSEPPSAFSPQTLLPNIYSPLDIQYRPLFADFLLSVRYELKVRNNLPFASENQRQEERLVYEKHFFKVEYQAYKRLYQTKLKEQLQANPSRAYLWDLNEFTLGVAYNELIKQKQKLINDFNESAKRLGEPTIDELDSQIVESFVMDNEEYAISTRLFRLYRQSFESNEKHIKDSAIGHKHSIIRQQAEFSQYVQWFSDDANVNNNPFHTNFFQKDRQNRELNRLQDLNNRLKRFMPNEAMKKLADLDLEDDIQRIVAKADSPVKLAINRQIQVTKNLQQLPSRYDVVVAPVSKKKRTTKEDQAMTILQDQSVPLLQRQIIYLDRIAEIKRRRELKQLRRQKQRFSGITSKFDNIIKRLSRKSDKEGLIPTDDQFADLSDDTDYERDNPSNDIDEELEPPPKPVVLDDFFPGLREFVSLDIQSKSNHLLSFPELSLIDANEEYLKQYQFLAQQATKNNKALNDNENVRDYDKNAVELGEKYSSIVKDEVVGKNKQQPNINAVFDPNKPLKMSTKNNNQSNEPSSSSGSEDDRSSNESGNEESSSEGEGEGEGAQSDPTTEVPDHLRKPQDFDQRLGQQLYKNVHFTDEFVASVKQRLDFEKQERFAFFTRDSVTKSEQKYEKSIRKYLRKKFPMLTDPNVIQEKIEEEKIFDKQQSELVSSFDNQLNDALETDIMKRQDQTDRVRKYQLQKALAITNKELDNYNRQEQQLLREIETQKNTFLQDIQQIYQRNLDTLYANIKNRDKRERETILQSFNSKMLPFVDRYKELERHLFDTERKVLIKHYNQQRFEALYQKNAAFQLDSDPTFTQLEEALARDSEYQFQRTFRPEYLDIQPIRASGEGSMDPNPNIGATNDPNSPEDTRPTADYKIDSEFVAGQTPTGGLQDIEDEKRAKIPRFAEIDPFNEPFKGISIGNEPDFKNLPEQHYNNILRNSLGIPHANEAVQALYALKGVSHTKLHAYYAFLGYDPKGRSIDDIMYHLSKLFGADNLARAVEYAKVLATDEIVVRLHTYRPKHDFVERSAVLLREINELRSITHDMNPELFKIEGYRPDGWGAFVLTLPYINYRQRYFETARLLADKAQEYEALQKYIQVHGLESEPLDKPHFDDFRTLFDAFSLAEQRKVKTFMHPFKRDGIFEVTALSTDLPRRRVAFATHQADLPEGYVMQDIFHGISDWDDFMQRRDQLFLDIRGTTAVMKELEAQLKHYCIAVVEPTLEHFIDVFLSSSNTTNHRLRRALDIERSTLNMESLRDYKKTKFLQEMNSLSQNPPLTGSLGGIDTSTLAGQELLKIKSRALHPSLQHIKEIRDGEDVYVDPNFINLDALQLGAQANTPLSQQLVQQHQAALLPPHEQWRTDNALRSQWNQHSQDLGHNGGLVNTYAQTLPEGNRSPESYRKFAFSRLFLPHYTATTEKNVIQAQGESTVHDLEVIEGTRGGKKQNVFQRILSWNTPQPQSKPRDPEFEEFLRIQQRQFTEDDKLRALRDKDFVINNAQSMRKELLSLDSQLEELYIEIQRTLPDDLNFIYTPIDINLSYSKLEMMLDTPVIRRPSHNRNTWDDRQLEDKENISQHQINRILQDPFLNIDLVNDTISRYIMMGKIISEQEGKRIIRQKLLEDELIIDEIHADDDRDSRPILIPNESDENREMSEMYSNFQSTQPRALRLLRQQQNVENRQIMMVNKSFDKLNDEMQHQLATVETSILHQLKNKFPTLPVPQLITEYNNKLQHLIHANTKEIHTLEKTEKELPDQSRQQLPEQIEHNSSLTQLQLHQPHQDQPDQQKSQSSFSKKLTHVSDTLQAIAAPLYKSRLPQQSPQPSDPSDLTQDQEYEVYAKLLRYAREQTDHMYQKQYPNMSKLDRLKLNPVNVPKRVNPSIPDQSAIYQKFIDEHQLNMWNYVSRRDRAQALIQERLLAVLPPFKTKADVRLHLLSLPTFISRDDLMEDPTPDLEYYVNYYNSLPHKIESINKRLELIPTMPEFITFHGRIQILESVIAKRHGHDVQQHRQFLQSAMDKLEQIKPDIVREFERLPTLLEQYQEEYDGTIVKFQVAELSAARKKYLTQIEQYSNQETERVRLEHLATEYHSIATMIESEYLLQLNLLFEQSLVSKDQKFLQRYQTARNDFNTIIASLKSSGKSTRGFYDKLDIISQTQQWCVNQTYIGPTIKKFLRHPEIAAEHKLRERRKETLSQMSDELKSANEFIDEVDSPYDTRTERRKQDVAKILNKTKRGKKNNFDLGDEDSDHDLEVLFSSQDKSPLNNNPAVQRGKKNKNTQQLKRRGATNPDNLDQFAEESEIDFASDLSEQELAFDDFDSVLMQQLVDESNLHVQYVDEEPPLDSQGNPIPWVLLPHTNPNPGLENGKSLYVQLKQHNSIARLLNKQYDVVQNLPDGDRRITPPKQGSSFNISPSSLLANMKQMLSNTQSGMPIAGPNPQEIFMNQFKSSRLGSMLSPQRDDPNSSTTTTFYRIPVFSVDELLLAKKLDRMQSAINIFVQFHTQYCYPDVIAARRRIFDPITNTAYLITNPHAQDKQHVLTQQERGNLNGNPTTTDIVNVLTGESKIFSDLASTALIDLDDRQVLPEVHAALRHQLRQAMQFYNSHMNQHGKPPEGFDPQSITNAEKWLSNDPSNSKKSRSVDNNANLNPIDSRYRRSAFDSNKFTAVRAEFFDWRLEIEELNLQLMDDYESLQFRQYEFDLYNAECEEAIDLYRQLKVYPHLRQAIVDEAAQLSGPPSDPNHQLFLNRTLVGKPIEQTIPTQYGQISIPSYFGNPENRLSRPVPPLLPHHASSTIISHPHTLSEATIVGSSFASVENHHPRVETSATLTDPSIKVLEPDLITNLPLLDRIRSVFNKGEPIITGNIGHSFFRGIFAHKLGDQHKHDMQATGADFYHPQTQGTPHYPDTFENFTAGYMRTRRWLKSTQEIYPEHQHEHTTTFRDYLSQLIRSRRWMKTTQFGSMQMYRDHVAARREERVNELIKGKLLQDLERLRTEKGGLDEIILYNHKLKFRQKKLQELADPGHQRRLLLDGKRKKDPQSGLWRFEHSTDATRSKGMFLSLPQNSIVGSELDLGPLDRRATFPQHQLDLDQHEEMESVLFKESLDTMSEQEKIQLVDNILNKEIDKLAIDESYYKDWADFPSLQDYRTVYNRYYSDVESGELSEIYRNSTGGLPQYFGQQILELDNIYQQYKAKQSAKKEMEDLTENQYQFKLEELLKLRKQKQNAANIYFLQQQNSAFLHTPFGSEVYQKRQTRPVMNPEQTIEEEQAKLTHKQNTLQQTGDDEGVSDLVKSRPDVIKHQVVDRGRKYFDSFDSDKIGYPVLPISFTDFVDSRTRMSLGTTLYGSVIQTPAVHQYHDALDPAPLPKEAAPPHFANYSSMHPDRLGYFITYYDAYRMKQPPESPFREYNILRPDLFQFLSVYPTYTLDGNFVHTPTRDPFEQAKDPSRANLFGQKLAKRKLYYLYWFLYGFLRPTVQIYTTIGAYSLFWLQSKVGTFSPEWSEPVELTSDYSLALNTYLPVMPF